MQTPPPRRTPNLSLTEADWLAIMVGSRAGVTDAELGRRWNLSAAAVKAQRHKRGVFRFKVGEAPAALEPPSADPPLEAPAQPKVDWLANRPRLILPEGEDPMAAADALFAHSRRLGEAGWMGDALAAAQLSRSHFATVSARRRALGDMAGPGSGSGRGEAEAPSAFEPGPEATPTLRPAQTPPPGDWRTWLFLGGRGAGKTLAGAAWLAGRAKSSERLALVGPTLGDVREVMIEGPSGLRGLAAGFGPEGGRPVYEPSRRRLRWPNGAVAWVFSAEDPDALRGPQFNAAWADEVCAWPQSATRGPDETLAMLRLGLRLGADPRLALTTTPRPTAGLSRLLAEPGLVRTNGSAADNAEHLAPGFVESLRALYGGTRLERQEIDGEVLEALEGAVFRRDDIARARALGGALGESLGGMPGAGDATPFDAVVVAVDPPAGTQGAACGIVVAARRGRLAWVLEDATVQGLSPLGWADRVAAAAARAALRGPVRVVAEVNQGGEMVRTVLVNAGLACPVHPVHASLSKKARAEPVALLYEQGRVAHAPGLAALEDQLLLLGAGGERGGKSPDRADALVWALTTLMLQPESAQPRIRVLW